MESGNKVLKSGFYKCQYHLKNIAEYHEGLTLRECNYKDCKCTGDWYFFKPLKQQAIKEPDQTRPDRLHYRYKNRSRNNDMVKKAREKPGFNKWDFEKW